MATNPLLHRETVECSILFLESGIPVLDLCTPQIMSCTIKDLRQCAKGMQINIKTLREWTVDEVSQHVCMLDCP